MTWITHGRRRELAASIFLLAMTFSHLVMLLELVPLLRNGYQDFTIFYTAGKMVRGGQSRALYDLSAQYRVQQEFAPKVRIRQAALPYNHPPFEALLFVPFTFLRYQPAYLLWTLLNLIALAVSVAVLRGHFTRMKSLSPALVGLAATGFFPIAIAIIQGQDSILLLLILIVSLVCMRKERDVSAGSVMALGLFKYHLIGPIVVLLGFRRPKLFLGFVPVAAALLAVSVAMIGWRGTSDYVQFVLHLEKSGAGGAIGADDMPNLRGLIAYLPGIKASGTLAAVLTLISSAAVFLIALRCIRRQRNSLALSFGVATATTVVVSYHVLAYDLTLLWPVALFLLYETVQSEDKAAEPGVTLLLLMLFLTPLYALLWFRLNRFCWFSVVLLGLFWELLRRQDFAAASSGLSPVESNTVTSIGK